MPRTGSAWCAGCRRGRSSRRARSRPRRSASTRATSGSRAAGILAGEIDRVDVLVLLRRVLGVLDGAVRRVAEPLGVGSARSGWSGAAWMAMSIASSMPCASTASRKSRNPSQPAQLGGDGVVAAIGRADGVRRADVVGIRPRARCCAPCGSCARSGGSAGGRRRRSPSPRSRQAPLGLGEGRGDRLRRIASLRAREELVPAHRTAPARGRRRAAAPPIAMRSSESG